MWSYVRYVEQFGAKVVPIHYEWSHTKIKDQLQKINGVILPGGSSKIILKSGKPSMYGRKVKTILEKAKEMNSNGIYFPILAICLGFQSLAWAEATYQDTLAKTIFDSINWSDKLRIVFNTDCSKLYRDIPEYLISAAQTEEVVFNTHKRGIFPCTFEKYPELRDNYRVLATNTDRQGLEYVATFEHKVYPFYAHQHHPEKVQFIFQEGLCIPRSEAAVGLAKYYSEFFVNECRLNWNRFESEDEETEHLINSARLICTKRTQTDMYVFNETQYVSF